jgi:hypothetical protein
MEETEIVVYPGTVQQGTLCCEKENGRPFDPPGPLHRHADRLADDHPADRAGADPRAAGKEAPQAAEGDAAGRRAGEVR